MGHGGKYGLPGSAIPTLILVFFCLFLQNTLHCVGMSAHACVRSGIFFLFIAP